MLRLVEDVTVVVPTIGPRSTMLNRALTSVHRQTVQPAMINVRSDVDKVGAAINRDLTVGIGTIQTEWLAFLDDDDEMEPTHLKDLLDHAKTTHADLVYPWFTVNGGTDPFPQWYGVPWDNATPHQIPITFLVKTDAYIEAGGFSKDWDPSQGADPGVDTDGNRAGEDYRFILRQVANGRKIVHLPKRTWIWYHHHSNTMGLPSRWS